MNDWTAAAAGKAAVSGIKRLLLIGIVTTAFAMGGCGGGFSEEAVAISEDAVATQPQSPATDESVGQATPETDTGTTPTTPTDPTPTPPTDPTPPADDEDDGGDDSGGDVVVPPPPVSGTISLSWRTPTERENGEPLALSDLGGYLIYYGPTSNPTANKVSVNDPSVTTYTLNGLAAGTYQVAVTAFDVEGMESELSNSMSKSIP